MYLGGNLRWVPLTKWPAVLYILGKFHMSFSVFNTLTGSQAKMSQNMVSLSEPSVNQRLFLLRDKAFQDRLTFLNQYMMVWFSWIFSICEMYWEYRTAVHLVFWKPWPVTGHIATAFLYYCILIFFVVFSYSWHVSLARTVLKTFGPSLYHSKAWIRSCKHLYCIGDCIQWIEKR